MGAFQLDSSRDLFVAAPHTNALWVWQLNAPRSAGVESKDWVYKHCIGVQQGKGFDFTILKIHGVEIKGDSLAQLIEDLYMSQLIVNCQGYSYLDTGAVVELSYSPHYYCLNDLFNWCEYTKLDPAYASRQYLTVTMTNWDRCDFRQGDLVLVSIKHSVDNDDDVRKDKEIDELRKKVASLEDNIKKRDARISELEAKRATDEASKEDRMIEQLRKKDDQIASLEKDLAKADEMICVEVKQLQEAQAHLENANKKIAALDAELSQYRKHKGTISDEVTPKKPFVQPKKPPPRVLVENPEKVVKSRKQKLADVRFEYAESSLAYTPTIQQGSKLRTYSPLDESVARRFPDYVLVDIGENGDFDGGNWCYIKAMDKEDWGETMIAFYDGKKFGTVQVRREAIPVPYKTGATFSSDREIFIAHIDGLGKRFVFFVLENP